MSRVFSVVSVIKLLKSKILRIKKIKIAKNNLILDKFQLGKNHDCKLNAVYFLHLHAHVRYEMPFESNIGFVALILSAFVKSAANQRRKTICFFAAASIKLAFFAQKRLALHSVSRSRRNILSLCTHRCSNTELYS